MAGKDGNSQYFEVKGGAKKPYQVTINYDTGHWCTCRGMISHKKTYAEDAGRTKGTSCKHIKSTIGTKFNDDWGKKVTGGGGRRTPATQTAPSSTPTTPAQPTGRRAAHAAQRAKRERESTGRRAAHKAQKANRVETPGTVRSDLSLLDRIDALAASREGATS